MINKIVTSALDALQDVRDNATIMISGFGDPGMPFALVNALLELAPRGITLISNNAGTGHEGIAALLTNGLVKKIICTYPRRKGSVVFEKLYNSRSIELELVPQGTLCERIRAAKAGICGFYTPATFGTPLEKGKEIRRIGNTDCVLELPIFADFALVKAHSSDRFGNLTYQASQRNFGPVMAGAASCTIVEVDEYVPANDIDPETVVTPGIYVDRVVVE